MTTMFTVTSGPTLAELEAGSEVRFYVVTALSDNTSVSGYIVDLDQSPSGRCDLKLESQAGVHSAWINNYDPKDQSGGYGEYMA